jgi:Ca2+-transporting ATPase
LKRQDGLAAAPGIDYNHYKGLSETEASRRLQVHGLNRIKAAKEKTVWEILLAQFLSPVIYLLIAASIISFSLGENAEGIAIVVVILINAALGFYMEWQAITSMKALKSLDVAEAKVMRDGKLRFIASEELTVDDLVYIEAGDLIPADSMIIESKQFQVDEAALTGESLPVDKKPDHSKSSNIPAEQVNRIFKGTIAVKGNAKAIVENIGMQTELGKISDLVQRSEQAATPLEEKLEALTKKLIWLTLFIAAAFLITGLLTGEGMLQMLETAIAMAVAAIPEGLPIVATIALAYGMIKMAKRNVIVKHLASVETLGSANIILTDKTGTLTENKIKVSAVVTADNNSKALHEKLFFISVLCNDAIIDEQKEIGDPLEIALLNWVQENNYNVNQVRTNYERIDEEAFSPETKLMATLNQNDSRFFICVKGAIEELIKKCDQVVGEKGIEHLNEKQIDSWLGQADELAMEGIRVLAFAYKESESKEDFNEFRQLILAGLVGFSDPPFENAPSAIDQCKDAGIKVVMLTGDHPSTALNIAKKIHLAKDRQAVINGKELDQLDFNDKHSKKKLLNATVFARVTPKQKLDIVRFYQDNGYIAAMTGDGVNDAPALKKADIGIAMGKRGTQIAKETADLVLKDDSFISIVTAVRQGRIIFENIRKCITFLLSCNLSEILVISLAAFLSLSSPLTPLQILYLNLITDVFPALALAVSHGNKNIMKHPPRDPSKGLLVTKDWQTIITYSGIITLSIFGMFVFCRDYLKMDKSFCNNIVFISLALAQLWHVFNLPSASVSFFKNEITTNKYIWLSTVACLVIMIATYLIVPAREVLSVHELDLQEVVLILVASLLPVLFIQLLKRLRMIA